MNRKTMPIAVALAAIAASIAVPAVAAAPAEKHTGPTVKATVIQRTLRVAGTPRADHITLRGNPLDRTQLQVDVGDDGSADFTFDLGTIDSIDVKGRGGDDTIKIVGSFTAPNATRIDGNGGNDTLLGGSGDEILDGGKGNDLVDGNGGTDTAFLGKGDDTFVWDPGDGSDVVEGGKGSDTMVFNGSGGNEIFEASANFGRVSFTRNIGTIVMDLDDVEAIDVNALGGTDTVTVRNAGGTDLERVNVDLAASLGGSTSDGLADVVNVDGTKGDDSIAVDANGAAVEVSGLAAFVRISHADPAKDTLVFETVAGADDVALDPAVANLIQFSKL